MNVKQVNKYIWAVDDGGQLAIVQIDDSPRYVCDKCHKDDCEHIDAVLDWKEAQWLLGDAGEGR